MSVPLYCDTHVRCYSFKELPGILKCAHDNFVKAARRSAPVESDALFALFLADGANEKNWNKLIPMATHGAVIDGWRLSLLRDGKMVRAESGSKSVLLAPAKSVLSVEGLELLILGAQGSAENEGVDEPMPAQLVLDKYSPNSIVVAPWSAERWLGKKGRFLHALIAKNIGSLYLGDCSTRPWVWKWVQPFKQTTNPILNGSRPHPLSFDFRRVGSFGMRLDYLHDRDQPSLSGLINTIKSSKPNSYGSPQSFAVYLVDRIRLLFS